MKVKVKDWLSMAPVERYMAIWHSAKKNSEGR